MTRGSTICCVRSVCEWRTRGQFLSGVVSGLAALQKFTDLRMEPGTQILLGLRPPGLGRGNSLTGRLSLYQLIAQILSDLGARRRRERARQYMSRDRSRPQTPLSCIAWRSPAQRDPRPKLFLRRRHCRWTVCAHVLPLGRVSGRPQRRQAGRDRRLPFYMSESQFEYWRHTQLTIDVVKGRGLGFSPRRRKACASSPAAGSSPTRRSRRWIRLRHRSQPSDS